jgi:glycosyltransferase involved in cell wall biosynthesis
MPGQFARLAGILAAEGHEVFFIAHAVEEKITGVRAVRYAPSRGPGAATHRYLVTAEEAILTGQAVARQCLALKNAGFYPELVVAHPGWGGSLFVREVFTEARLVNYCEFFYRPRGADTGFASGEEVGLDDACRIRTRNAHLLMALADCDRGFSPTEWQKRIHPAEFHDKLDVVFDGVDTERVAPDHAASFVLPNGRVLTRADQVVTYVARHLEPYRGFPSMMRAIPEILARRPSAQIVIAGSDGVAYGRAPADGRSWREVLVDEVAPDPSRVHFAGKLPYVDYLRLLQVSSAHVYLTVPFVLSWSMMEAMATGCVVIGSATPPVQEVIKHGQNGFLVDFSSPEQIAEHVVAALEAGEAMRPLRQAARRTILDRYEVGLCLKRQKEILAEVAGRGRVPRSPRRAPHAMDGSAD